MKLRNWWKIKGQRRDTRFFFIYTERVKVNISKRKTQQKPDTKRHRKKQNAKHENRIKEIQINTGKKN